MKGLDKLEMFLTQLEIEPLDIGCHYEIPEKKNDKEMRGLLQIFGRNLTSYCSN